MMEKLRDRLAAIGLLLTLILIAWLPVYPQDQRKVIDWPAKSVFNSHTNTTPDNHIVDRIDAVEIESISVEGRRINFGEPFTASDEWLNNISFQLKNISTKSLRQVQITLILPELGPTHRIQIQYICRDCARKPNPVAFDPGDVRELTLPEPIYNWARNIINEETTLSKISKAELLISYVTFADGTTISSDCLKTADPKAKCPYGPP
jgi:hypothetical protein